MAKLAVIILNYNSSSDCKKCIDYLQKQKGVDLEIVVVDNFSSRDKESEIIRKICADNECTFIQAAENRGYNAGNNIGLRYAARKGYQYALIANPDMEFPDDNYLKVLLLQIHEKPDVVICGSDIRTPEGVHQNPKDNGIDSWTRCFDWLKTIFVRGKKNIIPNWIGNPLHSAPCKILNGCCFLIRMSFIIEVNYFDEETFLYGEESILGKQVELMGKQAYYCADTYAIHNHLKSKEENFSFRFMHWKHSRLLYIKKYSGYPFYGKWLAIFSTHLYFLALKIQYKFSKKR